MWCCPFHPDKTPSMCSYDRDNHFYCFGCGARGDATDLVAKVRGVEPYRAATMICDEWHVPYEARRVRTQPKPPPPPPPIEARAIVALCHEWKRLVLEAAQGEIAAATLRLEQIADPVNPAWSKQVERACYFQDVANRYSCMTVSDLMEDIKQELAAYDPHPVRKVVYLGTCH